MALLFPSFGLGSLFYVGVLSLNAVCILSEDRFLARIGLGSGAAQETPGFGRPGDGASFKTKAVGLMNSIRLVARVPLIFVNMLVILYLLLLG